MRGRDVRHKLGQRRRLVNRLRRIGQSLPHQRRQRPHRDQIGGPRPQHLLAHGPERSSRIHLRRGVDIASDMGAVLDFFRGRLDFSPRPDDIFVASYPRSGTTWVQFILYQLTTPGDMKFDHISQISPWFERSLALGTMRASDFEAFASPRLFKTHLLPH